MNNDLSQFHDAFFEESFEAVDAMETGLLNLDTEDYDVETINTIFRGAHSIKGCSATFGFTDIANFVHVKETLLDKMRGGMLNPTQQIIDLLLKSIDTLRLMLTATRDGKDYDRQVVKYFTEQFNHIINSAPDKNSLQGSNERSIVPIEHDQEISRWQIHFTPHLEIMKTGNDPLRMFNALQKLGHLDCKANTDGLLDFRTIDPEDCYLSWELNLNGTTTKSELDEIFEWVADDCNVQISPIFDSPNNLHDHESTAPAISDTPVKKEKANSSNHSDASSIRVGIDKVDAIINLVGELVITQSMLDQLSQGFGESFKGTAQYEKLCTGLGQLERNTRELQESVMRIRMLPISNVFNRVPRIAHDLSKKLSKSVNIKMSGENTELDKTVLEKIGDPIIHLIRNAMDHGIEPPKQRKAVGKPETGTIHLNAYHKGGNIVVEIKDDGAGLNKQKIEEKAKARGLIGPETVVTDEMITDLIFHAGFSTADVVSDVSGRGVGMDVVKKNIKSLGGSIEVKSQTGIGTSFSIRLPLTLAILDGQLVRVGSEIYIIPLISIIESLQIKPENVNRLAGKSEIYKLRDEYIPFVRMHEIFNIYSDSEEVANGLMVIVEGDGKRAGLVVDDLLEQQQVVIKSLETNYRRIDGLSGATILGDGRVALIVDVTGLINAVNLSSISPLLSRVNNRTNQTATI